jgi:ABC-2 type transport system permease protein
MRVSFALLRLSGRQLLGWHRLGLLVFLCVLSALPLLIVATTLASARLDADLMRELMNEAARADFLKVLVNYFQLPLLYPAMILLLTATILREQIQQETIIYLWIKPISRTALVLSQYTVALLLAFVLSGLSLMITGALLVKDWALLGGLLSVVAVALAAYGAFFLALSTVLDRALLWGFVYLLGWEELFSRISPLASQWSIRHYAENLERSLWGESGVSLGASLGVLLGLTAFFLGIAIWRFSQMEFAGREEG